MKPVSQYNQRLLSFLDASPTPFHATANIRAMLIDAGFQPLNERDAWTLSPGGAYVVTRNDSSLIAWRWGEGVDPVSAGIPMVGAHTDSPCLKIRPNPVRHSQGCLQLCVEIYGGVLLAPWFDRDLSLAGRVVYRCAKGQLHSALLNVARPIAMVPSLAIHLDREANNSRSINPQTQVVPVAMLEHPGGAFDWPLWLKDELNHQGLFIACETVLDWDLCFYPTQPAAMVGLEQDFIASPRLDNLLSCHAAAEALMALPKDATGLIALNDHEEVGSMSTCGAQGPFLNEVLTRWLPDAESRFRCISTSMMVSADNAHAVHPNFAEKHDERHGPKLNAGPVIKVNKNQRYATTDLTASRFRQCCEREGVPLQVFVSRSDMGCGSTIGPITAATVGVPTLDVGVPTWSMHSAREWAGSRDPEYLQRALKAFMSSF